MSAIWEGLMYMLNSWLVMGGLALVLVILIVVFIILRNRREED